LDNTAENNRITFTEYARKRCKNILDPIAELLNRIGLMPNTVTILGLVGNTIGAYFLAKGNFLVGGLIILLMGPIDALDGSMARLRGEPTEFGAFVDSVTDRYSELVILGGLLLFYLSQGDTLGSILTYLAAAGSVLVSYIRARSQSVGYETKVGMLSRFERFLILVPCLLIAKPTIAMAILAVFANLTALQRIVDVRRKYYQKHPKDK